MKKTDDSSLKDSAVLRYSKFDRYEKSDWKRNKNLDKQ